MERPLTARGAARRAALLDAAIGLVAHEGSGALTHRAIAARARVSLASVTYHFSSIDDLRASMFEHAVCIVDGSLAETAARSEEATDTLPELAADFTVTLLREHREAAIAMQEMIIAAAHEPGLRPTFQSFHRRLGELLAPCVGGHDAGLTAAAAVQGLILTALTDPDLDLERLHHSVSDLVDRLRTHGHGPRPPVH